MKPIEDIPGELPADRRAREAKRKRSVTYKGRGTRRRRVVQKRYNPPIIEQNEGRVVSVERIGRVEP